jgi:hypothetical protein
VHPIVMKRIVLELSCAFLLLHAFFDANLTAQQEQKVQSGDESTYGSRFFDQLRTIFGRFREADLQRVFREAQSIQCSELVGRKGEWRTVAFFNEDRSLGDWYRANLEEVKADLAVYTFKGNCIGERGTVQVGSEFPTDASIEELKQRRIKLDEVDITVNDPVDAVMNPQTMAYTFELPYLFLTKERGSKRVYSYVAPDRNAAYATDMTSRWECKTAASEDVTYRFLICRVSIFPQGMLARNKKSEERPFGSAAFYILSDGTEAQTSVHLTFGDGTQSKEPKEKATETPPAPSAPGRPVLKRK